MSTAAVVPAAGLGTRLRPLSDSLPKEMLPVGRRPALDWIFEELSAAGIDRIVVVASPAKEALLTRHLALRDDAERFRLAIQPQMRGLGDAILHAETAVGDAEQVLVALGDAILTESEPGAVVSRLLAAPGPVAIAVQKVPRERLSRYGVVQPCGAIEAEGAFRIASLVEKPNPDDAPSDYAVTARYRAPRSLFAALRGARPGRNGELQITEALADMVEGGLGGWAIPLLSGETRHDIGGYDTYFKAFVTAALDDAEHGAALREYLRGILR